MNTVFHIIPLNKTETWAQQTAPSKIIGTNQWDRQLEDGGQLCTELHFHHRLYTGQKAASQWQEEQKGQCPALWPCPSCKSPDPYHRPSCEIYAVFPLLCRSQGHTRSGVTNTYCLPTVQHVG